MDRKSSWLIAATILAGFLILGFSQAIAQREFRTDTRPATVRPDRWIGQRPGRQRYRTDRRFRAGGGGAEREAGGTQIVLVSAPATSAR